jgi:hypothetical protein
VGDLSELLIAVVKVKSVVAGNLQLLHVLYGHAEDEDVLLTHLLSHLKGTMEAKDAKLFPLRATRTIPGN